jgi:hypothetical protein
VCVCVCVYIYLYLYTPISYFLCSTAEIEVNEGGTGFNTTLEYFAYTDNVIVIQKNSRKLEEAFQQLETALEKAGLKRN